MSHSTAPPYSRTTSTSAKLLPPIQLESQPIYGLDDSPTEPTRTITLIAKNGIKLQVQSTALLQSELCHTMLEGDSTVTEIELNLIDSDILKLIVEYLTYHIHVPARHIPKPIPSIHINELVDNFDATYIDALNQLTLFKLMLAANYMNIKSLIALCGAKVATLIKGQTPQQLMQTFNIRTDYTAAEEEEIKSVYKELIG